ncbi:hypothetical protein WP12_10045 [Sphingomonas sp. SRS2]|nr:hypothetical protein WP12_10045 [Sphingomonas sp. SRS2]
MISSSLHVIQRKLESLCLLRAAAGRTGEMPTFARLTGSNPQTPTSQFRKFTFALSAKDWKGVAYEST